MAVQKWSHGKQEGLMTGIVSEWHHCSALSAAGARKQRHLCSVMEFSLQRQCHNMAAEDLLAWHQAARASAAARARRGRARGSVERLVAMGVQSQVVLSCLWEWHHSVSIERIFAGEVAKRDKRLGRQERDLALLRAQVKMQQDELNEQEGLVVAMLFGRWKACVLEEKMALGCERLGAAEAEIWQLQETQHSLQLKLTDSYEQIDQVMATMMKELRSKENLTSELRNANVRAQGDLMSTTLSSSMGGPRNQASFRP